MYENLKKLIYSRNYQKTEVIKKLEVLMAINQINSTEYNFINLFKNTRDFSREMN